MVGLLSDPRHNAVVNLLGVDLANRPECLRVLIAQIQELRTKTGRPHWLILDEAHHLLPPSSDANVLAPLGQSMLLLTVHPDSISRTLLSTVDTVMVTGESPEQALRSLAKQLDEPMPEIPTGELRPGECLLWLREQGTPPVTMETIPPAAERRRHRRKYAEGEVGEDRSFYFRGPDHKLNLRAYNLLLFMQMAQGVGDEVWLYHLRRGDYSQWFHSSIKDEDLAAEAAAVEQQTDLSAAASRAAIEESIRKRYTGPARPAEIK